MRHKQKRRRRLYSKILRGDYRYGKIDLTPMKLPRAATKAPKSLERSFSRAIRRGLCDRNVE